jgi:hypothetical protein
MGTPCPEKKIDPIRIYFPELCIGLLLSKVDRIPMRNLCCACVCGVLEFFHEFVEYDPYTRQEDVRNKSSSLVKSSYSCIWSDSWLEESFLAVVNTSLKGLSHEMDFKNFDKILQN